MSSEIRITIKLFAAYQEAYGSESLTRLFPVSTAVSDVLNVLLTEHPELEKWRSLTRFGVNLEFVEAERLLKEGDEVVFIPPVSGG